VAVLGTAFMLRRTDKTRFAIALTALIFIEYSFHTTVGHDEQARLALLGWHLLALVFVAAYSICAHPWRSGRLRLGVFGFLFGMILIGALGLRSMPGRTRSFSAPDIPSVHNAALQRLMGLRGFLFPNAAAPAGAQDVRSITSLSIARFQLFQDYCLLSKPQPVYKHLWLTGLIDEGRPQESITEEIKRRYLFYALAGVTNYFSYAYEDMPHTKLVEDSAVKNYYNLIAFPRSFVVYQWEAAATPREALVWLLKHPDLLRSRAVVETDQPLPRPMHGGQMSEARIRSYGLHSVVIDAVLRQPGLLLLTDTYHSDWRVFVDGRRKEMVPADVCFRGVFLDAGSHEVRFVYFPVAFYVCCSISGIALFGLLLFIGRTYAKRRSR